MQTSHSAVTSQMLTTRLACMPELISAAPTGRLCLARFSFLPSLSCPASELKYCSYTFFHPSVTIIGIIMQWEYQVGPSVGIEAGDHIWASRYILEVTHPNHNLVAVLQLNGIIQLVLVCRCVLWFTKKCLFFPYPGRESLNKLVLFSHLIQNQ